MLVRGRLITSVSDVRLLLGGGVRDSFVASDINSLCFRPVLHCIHYVDVYKLITGRNLRPDESNFIWYIGH